MGPDPSVTETTRDIAQLLITLGSLFLLGLATDLLGRRTPLPRVTLLLLFGVAIGPSGLGLLADEGSRWLPAAADMALVMVGFLLGGGLTRSSLGQQGRIVLGISFAVVLATVTVAFVGLRLLGAPTELALLLAGIATSTAPAATIDVVHELRAEGPFTRALLGIVAIDDVWGLIVFSLLLAAAQGIAGDGSGEVLLGAAWDLGGALVVGVALGVPMAYLTGRVEPGEPTLVEALGGVLLCGGIALWLDVSFLLAAMVQGAVVANLARHHRRPIRAIEGIDWPFMILFFVLAGASLHVDALVEAGLLGLAYLALRMAGRLLGAWAGARWTRSPASMRRWMGLALVPQAGVALGMALVAIQRFPELADRLLPVVVSATVVFEIVGPVLTRRALVATGEASPELR